MSIQFSIYGVDLQLGRTRFTLLFLIYCLINSFFFYAMQSLLGKRVKKSNGGLMGFILWGL